MTGGDEAQARALFQERYRCTPSLLTRPDRAAGHRRRLGANGFTTMDQADTLARELHLSAADRLLDVGSGRGWPGLYLAAPDRLCGRPHRPAPGRVAGGRQPRRQRSALARTGVVASAASGLPFQAGSFDVIIHTDVLC